MEEGATIRIWWNCLHIRICAELFLGPDNKVCPFIQFMRFSQQVYWGGLPFPPPFPLGRKAMANRDSVLKSRDITMPTRVHRVKDMVFPVVKYGCESWTIKKEEHRRINAFEL